MSRQRWGTFSVADHLRPDAFIADVLLYDRLILPVPSSAEDRQYWRDKEWDPAEQDRRVDILKELVIPVPWNETNRTMYRNRVQLAGAAAQDAGDGFMWSRMVLAEDLLPTKPEGVSKVWPVVAYASVADYSSEVASTQDERRAQLGTVVKHRFLVPKYAGKSELEMLAESAALARRDDFIEKRAALHQWIEDVITQDISDAEAVGEMDDLLVKYNEIVRKACREVYWKFGYTIVPTALAIAGSGALAPLAAVGGLIALYRFARSDSKPVINAKGAPAAMLHDVRADLSWV